MRAASLKQGMTTEKGGSMGERGVLKRCNFELLMRLQPLHGSTLKRVTNSFVNLDDKLAVWINIASVHSRGVKRQGDVAFTVNGDQSAGAAEPSYFIQNTLRGFLERHSAIFHQRRNIVTDGCANKIFALKRGW